MAGWISIYNRRIDKTKTVYAVGKNGIHYEYIMPIFGEREKYLDQALDVKSKKSPKSKYKNGKKPGQYQPVGDKRYFNYYQIQKMKTKGDWEDFLLDVLEREQFILAEQLKKYIIEEFGEYEQK